MNICPDCGAEIDELMDGYMCPECDRGIFTDDEVITQICPNCDNEPDELDGETLLLQLRTVRR